MDIHSQGDVKMFGVTPPISTDSPKPADIQASEGELDLYLVPSKSAKLTWRNSSHGRSGSSEAVRVGSRAEGPVRDHPFLKPTGVDWDDRERLLSNIAQLVSKFVHDVSIQSGLSEKVASEAGGRIYTSGSYRFVPSLSTLQL